MLQEEKPILSLNGVSVSFPVYQGGSRSLKKSILSRGSAGRIARDAHDRITVEALRNVSLSLSRGDRLALVGTNGAGKTTLLRVMAGIYEPTVGAISVRGRISPMFDIGLGIDGDLSGYENIRIRGLLLGLSAQQIEQLLPEIAEFTELDDYLDMPVRTYSSGMMLRLNFAVATCFEPEILLMDEWILAGDAHFLNKARARIDSFVQKASVLVLASHNLDVCARWCNKALWMEDGRVREFGDSTHIVSRYGAAAV
jgi:ABC-2 type transport system ATP-binding protein/lipopolysaccharide transport system ATP-binding protein